MSKLCVEGTLGLSVNKLLRWGHIDCSKQAYGSVYWGDEDDRAGSIGFVCSYGNVLVLDYSANGEPIRQAIDIVWTACHYGNKRPWFECPICHRRAGRIFYRSWRFACRRCQKLCYASQLEKVRQRGLGLSHKLYDRFESDKDWIYKPKGMHWKTFDRILARAQRADERSMQGLMQWINSR